MKFAGLLIVLLQPAYAADVVTRWTDENGQVHYGDHLPMNEVTSHRQMVIEDSYDQEAYDAAIARYVLYEKELKQREKQRKELEKQRRGRGGKAPLTEADKYDLYMERQDELKRQELERKRKRRADTRRKWKLNCYDQANIGKAACR